MPDSDPKPVAVDGAEGFLGRAVARALLKRNVPVRAIVADPGAIAPAGVEVAVAPLGDADAIGKAVEGARAVVAARKLLEERPREGLTFKAVHVERTRALLDATKAAGESGPERFLYVGVAGLKAERPGRLAEAEREAEALLVGAKMPAVALRASLVVGPGDGHVSRMAAKAQRGWPVLIFVGQGWARSAPMTARDFGRCAAKVLLGDDFPTEPLSIGGPELLTAMEIQDRLLATCGRNKLKVHTPESLARFGAMFIEKVSGRPPVTRSRLAWLLEDFVPDRVTSTKILGRRPRKFETAFPRPQDAHDPRPAEAPNAGA
ncbi:MAG: SDR family oxidoreductase [Planctomycetota bacterium]